MTQRKIVFCVDEKTAIQALGRRHPCYHSRDA